MKKDQAFGLVPVYKDGEKLLFLLTRHVLGHWAFPKGHPEGAETPLQTAKREFEEETGITDYEVDDSISWQEHYFPVVNGEKLDKTVIFYLGLVNDQTVNIQEAEVQDYGWFSYEEALERLTFDEGRKVLQQANKYLHRQKNSN